MLKTAISIRANIYHTAGENNCSAQKKPRRDHNRCHQVPIRVQVGQKVLLKNQRRMNRKCGKRFRPFSVHLISNKKLCSSISKDIIQIDHAFLLKPYLNLDETKVSCKENHPPSANGKQLNGTETIDLPSLTEKQILTEEKFDNYAFTKIPDKIVQTLLVDALKSSKNFTETCYMNRVTTGNLMKKPFCLRRQKIIFFC